MTQPRPSTGRAGPPRAAALLAMAVLVLAAVAGAVVRADAADRAGVTAVDAAVLDTAPLFGDTAHGTAAAATPARVSWGAGDGRTVVATVPVPAGTRAGETVHTWAGADGSPAPPPTGGGSAVAVLLTLVAGTAAAAGALAGQARSRSHRLARDWARVEPSWSGRNTPDREER